MSDQNRQPTHRRVYVSGNGDELRVPMREVLLEEPNPPLRLYDTSGPHGDPDCRVSPREGLPALRRPWITRRGDVEQLPGSTSV